MKEQIINSLSQKLDDGIVKDLINIYEKTKNEFIKGNYEEVQSKSGKFVENVFRILNFVLTQEVINEIQSSEMNKLSKKLKELSDPACPESIRLLIPNIAQSLIYQPRS